MYVLRFHIAAAILSALFVIAAIILLNQSPSSEASREIITLAKIYVFALICAFFALRKQGPS